MADWEKDIGMLKTDVKYIREDIGVMQKQIRDLNKTSHMGLGGIKVLRTKTEVQTIQPAQRTTIQRVQRTIILKSRPHQQMRLPIQV